MCHVSLHPSLGRSHALLISIAKVISRSLGRQLQSLKVVIGASERERKSSIVYHPGGTRNLFVVVPRICLRPPRGPVKGSCSSRPSLTPAEEGVPSLCRRLANKENGASVVVRKTDRQTERERERGRERRYLFDSAPPSTRKEPCQNFAWFCFVVVVISPAVIPRSGKRIAFEEEEERLVVGDSEAKAADRDPSSIATSLCSAPPRTPADLWIGF